MSRRAVVGVADATIAQFIERCNTLASNCKRNGSCISNRKRVSSQLSSVGKLLLCLQVLLWPVLRAQLVIEVRLEAGIKAKNALSLSAGRAAKLQSGNKNSNSRKFECHFGLLSVFCVQNLQNFVALQKRKPRFIAQQETFLKAAYSFQLPTSASRLPKRSWGAKSPHASPQLQRRLSLKVAFLFRVC